MNNIIDFFQDNKDWFIPIITAITALIVGILGLYYKNGKTHKQKFGNIKNSQITNINGDINQKKIK